MGYRREDAARYSFLLAIVVFLKFVSTRGYMPFVYYRIALGFLVLALLRFGFLKPT